MSIVSVSGSISLLSTIEEDPDLTEKSPELWGGPPEYFTEDTFDGHHITRRGLNDGLRRAYESGDELAWIFARARCEVLKLGPKPYALEAGLGTAKAIASLEEARERTRDQPETYAKVFALWDAKQSDTTLTVPERDLLVEAKERALDLLSEPYGKGVDALLRRWRFEVGTKKFTDKTGLDSGSLYQRREHKVPSSPQELLTFARKLGLLPTNVPLAKRWEHPRVKQILAACIAEGRSRGRSKAMVTLHTMVACVGEKFSSTGLSGDIGRLMQVKAAARVSAFAPVPWKQVSKVVKELKKSGLIQQQDYTALSSSWRQALQATKSRFEAVVKEEIAAIPLTNQEIANALGVESGPPTKRGRFVRRALRFGDYEAGVFPAAIAAVVSEDATGFYALLSQKRKELQEDRLRSGGAERVNTAIEADIWGLAVAEVKTLMSELSCEDGAPQLLERIQSVGLGKLESFLSNIRGGETELTVARIAGSIERRELKTETIQNADTTMDVINLQAHDQQVVDRPRFRNMLIAADLPDTGFRFERAWYSSAARHHFGDAITDMGRVLEVWMSSEYGSRTSYLHSTGCSGGTEIAVRHAMASGQFTKNGLSRLLEQSGETEGPLGIWIKTVNETGSIRKALPLVRDAFKEAGFREEVKGIELLRKLTKAELARKTIDLSAPEESIDLLIRHTASVIRVAEGDNGLNQPEREQVLKALRALPGVLSSEFAAINRTSSGKLAAELESVTPRLEERGLSGAALCFVLKTQHADSRERPSDIIERAVALGTAGSVASPATLAVLIANDSDELAAIKEGFERAIKQDLKSAGIDASPAHVLLKLHGLEYDQLSFYEMRAVKTTWNPAASDLPESELVQELEKHGRLKEARALARLASWNAAISPSRVISNALDAVSDGAHYFTQNLKIAPARTQEYSRGKRVPYWPRYEAILNSSRIPVSAERKLAWSLAYPATRQDIGPLLRCLETELVSSATTSTDLLDYEGNEALHKAYLNSIGLKPVSWGRRLSRMRAGKPLAVEQLSELLEAAKVAEHSPARAAFLTGLNNGGSVAEQLVLLHQKPAQGVTRTALETITQFARELQKRPVDFNRLPFDSLLSATRDVPHVQEIEPALAAALEIVRGASIGDFVEFGKAIELPGDEDVDRRILDRDWVKQAKSMGFTPGQRISLVRSRLEASQSVTVEEVVTLFNSTPLQQSIALVSARSQEASDVPYVVASLDYYDSPSAALSHLAGLLADGGYVKHRGPELLEYTAQFAMVRQSSSNSKIQATSIGLYVWKQ